MYHFVSCCWSDLISIEKDTRDTALLTSNDFGISIDAGDVWEENKEDENPVEEVGIGYIGYGSGEGNYRGGDCRGDDERYIYLELIPICL